MQLSPDGPYTSIGTQRGDPEDHEPIDRKRMAKLSSQMSRSHHPVEKAMAPVPVRDARQSFPPFDGVFSPFKHGSIRHGRTARTADRAVLVELRRFLAGVHAHWDVPDVHSPIGTDPRRWPGQAGVLEHIVKREAPPREHFFGIGSAVADLLGGERPADPASEDPADLPPLQCPRR